MPPALHNVALPIHAFLLLSSSAAVGRPTQRCITTTDCGSQATWEHVELSCCPNQFMVETRRDSSYNGNSIAKSLWVDTFLPLHSICGHMAQPSQSCLSLTKYKFQKPMLFSLSINMLIIFALPLIGLLWYSYPNHNQSSLLMPEPNQPSQQRQWELASEKQSRASHVIAILRKKSIPVIGAS